MRYAFLHLTIICFLLIGLCLPASAKASDKRPSVRVEQSGELPRNISMVVRSGLAWMDEKSPLFLDFEVALKARLTPYAISIVPASPSVLEAPLHTPLVNQDIPDIAPSPIKGKKVVAAGTLQSAKLPANLDEEKARLKALEGIEKKQFKPLRLASYGVSAKDSKLPASVLAVKPPNTQQIQFFLSQQDGLPLMRQGGSIPGRIPQEIVLTDPKLADYALIVRFSLVRPSASRSSRGYAGIALGATSRGSLTAGSGIGSYTSVASGNSGLPPVSGGVDPDARPGPSYGGTPGDYVRGYEIGGPSTDFWNRRHDMNMPNYTRPDPPQVSQPPASSPAFRSGGRITTSPSGIGMRTLSPQTAATLAAPGSGVLGATLEMDCWDLRPVATGKNPIRVWRSVVQQRADTPNLSAMFPDMITAGLQGIHK